MAEIKPYDEMVGEVVSLLEEFGSIAIDPDSPAIDPSMAIDSREGPQDKGLDLEQFRNAVCDIIENSGYETPTGFQLAIVIKSAVTIHNDALS